MHDVFPVMCKFYFTATQKKSFILLLSLGWEYMQMKLLAFLFLVTLVEKRALVHPGLAH